MRAGQGRRGLRLGALALALALGVALVPTAAWAHVKWFSEFSYADRPRTLQEALTPTVAARALPRR